MDYKSYIREMKGKNRCDITQLLNNPVAFNSLIKDIAKPFIAEKISKVVALDAMGFILGGAVAYILKTGLVLARKGGKSAWLTETAEFTDYSDKKKNLEIAKDALKSNDRVLVVDEWSETGAQLKATINLIERFGAIVVGISCINIDRAAKEDKVLKKYRLHSALG